ncbi:calcium-transporting ATPase 8, plasma membrane-type-like isoform X2 [Silene latifolia]|uniref:calcium-transporting ATPase 8, plasma membrane-type-like isoform X2 n=1 Tax=Silene latifolia TaxID=37657 RepID=UPI003D781AB1
MKYHFIILVLETLVPVFKLVLHLVAMCLMSEYLGTQGNQELSDCLYGIEKETLLAISREANFSALQMLGGINGLAEKLKTNLEKGILHIDDDDLFQRKSTFGSNSYPVKKGLSFLRLLWEACQDQALLTLIVAAVALLALGVKSEGIKEGWYTGGSILFAVTTVIIVIAISDYIQYLQFQKVDKEKRNIHTKVVRGGRSKKISIDDVVVGDVVPLKIGDQVCADGVLISGHSLAIDESFDTEECEIVTKDSNSPFLMAGCNVADGWGTMLVTNVGMNTTWASHMTNLPVDTDEETPLQVRLNGLATVIGKAGLLVAFVVLMLLLARYFTGHMSAVGMPHFKAGKTSLSSAIDGVIKITTAVVTIVIVAVADGLPLAITLTLACFAKRMLRDKALVRRLSACEIMGSATTICCDKTGTLTKNQMNVMEAYASGRKLDPQNSGLSPVLSSLLLEGIAQNTTGSVLVSEDGTDATVFSPTEKAILSWGKELGMNFDAIRSETAIIHASPFKSEKKRGGVAVQAPGSEARIHWKGAADVVLASCNSYMDENDQVVPMTEQKLDFYKNAIEQMASQSLRCIAIAYRSCEFNKEQSELSQWVLPEDELILLAIVGLKDPCRSGVKDSIELCKTAGIKMRMVTGDSLMTAKAIALECGILALDSDAFEPNLINGESFRNMSEKERENIAEKITVMVNSSPSDKCLLIKHLKKGDHVVAVAATGDGTNDAPALREADVALTMGIASTEVAKDSSDIVILDDDYFASVVKIVQRGRSVYANIQKFTQFQLTVNVVALTINVTGAFSTGDVPLNCVQLLWVYLMTYTLGALALATEPPTDNLMRTPPADPREVITDVMWRNLLIQVVYQVVALLVFKFKGQNIFHLQHEAFEPSDKIMNTVIFNTFVLCQIFNEFNARRLDQVNIFEGITRHRLFMVTVAVTLILQIIIIEFFGKFASVVRLSWQLWLVCLLIGFISCPLAALGKLIPVPKSLRNTIWMLFPLCVPCFAPKSRHRARNFHRESS